MDCPKCGAANLDKAMECDRCKAPLLKRARGWVFQHPLLVSVSGALVAGMFSLAVAVINTNAGEEHKLIPVDQMQADAFAPDPADPNTPKDNVAPAFPKLPEMPDWTTPGNREGVYGRTGDGVSCDVGKLIAYLEDPAHASQAVAWAGAAHIGRADIRAYFLGLTPVRLRFDTKVTNYDYRDGQADGYQAVLQAGTSVLVDKRGVPRAKCNCGNPLMEPSGSGSTDEDVDDFASNPDDAWDGFNPGEVVTVRSGQEVSEFVLMDLDDGEVFRRTVGSNGSGDTAVGPSDPSCGTLGQSTSCGGPGPQATPEDVAQLEKTLQRLVKAVEENDCRTLINSMSAALVQQFNLGDEGNVAACEQGFQVLEELYGGLTIDETKVLSVSGASAVVSVTATVDGQTSTEENHFVRENGSWKLTL